MGSPRQEYWSEIPFPASGDLPDPGIEPEFPVSPTLADRFSTTERFPVWLPMEQMGKKMNIVSERR